MAEATRRVYGIHAVNAVVAARPDDIVSAVLLDGAQSRKIDDLARALGRLRVPTDRLPRSKLDRLCAGGAHQGAVVEVRAGREFSLSDFESLVLARGRAVRLLVLDQVEDPRNLGACLRTADAAHVDAVVVPRARSAKLTGAAIKAAAGAAVNVPLLAAPNLARTLDWLKHAGVWVVGTDAAARQTIYSATLEPPVAIVLGAEGKGLRRLTRESCDELVAIPMHGRVESLNVSVAAGVVLFELLRQAPP